MVNRREFLLGLVAGGMTACTPSLVAPSAPELTYRPRSAWADAPPTGPISPEDPLYLIVHHTSSRSDYTKAEVPSILRAIYANHTGGYSGGLWSDIAYNFIVDRFGTIWEARAGSADGPVAGDATGGNQGHSILCCWLGSYNDMPPSLSAIDAMVALIAWQAARYGIDVSPGATVSFTSRGSSLWPQGVEVTTATICGHRDMSDVTCPGDAGYQLVESLPELVTAASA